MAVLLAFALTSCASSSNFKPKQPMAAEVATQLSAPTVEDMIAAQQEYLIGPQDELQVSVFGVNDLNTIAQVDANGYFAMPLIGPVMAAGETAPTLSRKIADSLGRRYLRNPQVTVLVKSAVSQQMTVDGGVAQPGIYPVIGRTSLMRAVARAGGLSEYGKDSEVLVFRKVGGKSMVALFNLRAIRGGRADDPQIFGNDIVIVGTDTSRRLLRDLLQLTPLTGVFYQILSGNN